MYSHLRGFFLQEQETAICSQVWTHLQTLTQMPLTLCVRFLCGKTGDQRSLDFLAARKIPARVNTPIGRDFEFSGKSDKAGPACSNLFIFFRWEWVLTRSRSSSDSCWCSVCTSGRSCRKRRTRRTRNSTGGSRFPTPRSVAADSHSTDRW